jgi:hypothetical protein
MSHNELTFLCRQTKKPVQELKTHLRFRQIQVQISLTLVRSQRASGKEEKLARGPKFAVLWKHTDTNNVHVLSDQLSLTLKYFCKHYLSIAFIRGIICDGLQ